MAQNSKGGGDKGTHPSKAAQTQGGQGGRDGGSTGGKGQAGGGGSGGTGGNAAKTGGRMNRPAGGNDNARADEDQLGENV